MLRFPPTMWNVCGFSLRHLISAIADSCGRQGGRTAALSWDRYMVLTVYSTRDASKCCMQRDRSKTDETANLTTACNARRGLHSSTLFLCPPFCRLSDPPSDPPTIPPANHPSSRPWPRRVECWPQRKIEKHLIGNYEPSACLSKKQKEKQKRKILKSTEHNRRTRYLKNTWLKNFNCSIWGCSTGKYPRH